MKTYETPEIFELGDAITETRSCSCKCSDGCCGKKSGGEDE